MKNPQLHVSPIILILAVLCGFAVVARGQDASQPKVYGVGLELREKGSNIVVNSIAEDSPAARQNQLHKGDRILSVAESNGPAIPVPVGEGNLSRTVALIRGAKGTAVTLTFGVAGKEDSPTQSVTLVRGDVHYRLGGEGRLLTNGTKAPDIEWVSLTDGSIGHLSEYAGKIVVLEFWASWCPPCQKSMADLQLDPARYPNWKDKVVLIAASVDETAEVAAKHIAAKGWNQTHNVWLKTKDVWAYHIGGIPAAYVIDEKGNIAFSGTGDEVNIPDIVNRQLAGDPKAKVVGTWEVNFTKSVRQTYSKDGTYHIVVAPGGPSDTGTWSIDSNQLTMTFPDLKKQTTVRILKLDDSVLVYEATNKSGTLVTNRWTRIK